MSKGTRNSRSISRRYFMRTGAVAATATALAPAILRGQDLNSKLNIASIGVGGRGGAHLGAAASENLVAICDVDENTLNGVAARPGYEKARKFFDYREMFDKIHKEIDAVFVAVPDHHHFAAAMRAVMLKKHVYCEKPLTHTIWEARTLAEAAKKAGVMTQMGNQGHSGDGYRILCEYVWSGALGEVREVHSWTNRPIWPQGIDRPAGSDPVPAHLKWDLWLGPAPERPFKDAEPEPAPAADANQPANANGRPRRNRRGPYHPFNWRGWWDFGTGALGDMGCHILDGPVWALKLKNPTKVELVESSELKSETAPKWSVLRYHFPEREGMPPCVLTWYDGAKKPERPTDLEPDRRMAEGDNGSVYIGSKASFMTGTYGGGPRIFPEEKMLATPKPEEMVPRVRPINGVDAHHADWIRSCKDGKPSSANFDYAGPFTEVVLLGNLALRVGKTIEWDAKNMRVTNAPEANQYVKAVYRKGWEV
jgi:predicted dehydrogenase